MADTVLSTLTTAMERAYYLLKLYNGLLDRRTGALRAEAFLDLHRDDLFVWQRIEWNLRDEKPPVAKEGFWQ